MGGRRNAKQEAAAREYTKALEDGSLGTEKSKTDILLASGYSQSTIARKGAGRLIEQNPILQGKLAEYGFSQEKVAKVLEEAASANIVTVFKGHASETDVPDHKLRMQAISLVGDFTGTKKSTVEKKVVNINVEGKDLDRILG